MEIINTLKNLGCEVILVGDKIKVKSLPGIEVDLELINSLTEELKSHKQEAIAYLSAKAEATQDKCFDPNGFLQTLLSWARKNGKSDNELIMLIDDIIKGGTLKAPWGMNLSPFGRAFFISPNKITATLRTH